MSAATSGSGEVVVDARGDVDETERAYAGEKIGELRTKAPAPVLFARVALTAHADPARPLPAFAKAELDVNGQLVRAHASGSTMSEAIDLLDARLRERLDRFASRAEAKRRRFRDQGEHEWRHGEEPSSRRSSFPRPVEERELVRRKTFAVGESTPDDAVDELESLDHDFYLFKNRETGEDNVVARAEDAGYELLEPSTMTALGEASAPIRHAPTRPSTLTVEGATELLDAADLAFVFFLDLDSGRGRVAYRRYDGHYGLIVPSDDAGASS